MSMPSGAGSSSIYKTIIRSTVSSADVHGFTAIDISVLTVVLWMFRHC